MVRLSPTRYADLRTQWGLCPSWVCEPLGGDPPRRCSGTIVGIKGHLAAPLFRHLPGQEGIDVRRDPTTVLCTTLEELRQPGADVDLGHCQSSKQGKEHRR